jgi:hypothetical protein
VSNAPGPSRAHQAFAIAALVLGCLGAMSRAGALMNAFGSSTHSAADELWRASLGWWLAIGHAVEVVSGALLAATGVALLRRAQGTRTIAVAYGAVAVTHALVGFYLVEDELRPRLVRLGVGSREEQLLGAYVEGGLMLHMVIGVLSVVLAVAVVWVALRSSGPPTDVDP